MARSQKSSRALLRLLKDSSDPIYVLDGDRRILFANAACAAWLGIDDDALLGLRCDYHEGASGSAAERLAARLCPPPQVFGGQPLSAFVACETPVGASRRRVHFVPLDGGGSASEESAAVLAVVGAVESDAGDELPADGAHAESAALHERLIELRRELGLDRRLDRLAGESDAVRRVRDQVRLASASRGRVLLVGPPGCGSEAIARIIHYGHAEPRGRLVPLACPLLDAELLQATITDLKRPAGYRRGEPQGTLLLLEVDRLPAEAQDELAGFLMLPGFELETIATAEAPLLELAREGAFRLDLAYALATLTIELPPLRDRPADLPLLAQQLLEEGNAAGGAQLAGFTPEALDVLAGYAWPGDVDELAAAVGEARRRAAGPLIGVADLPERLHLAAHAEAHPLEPLETIDLDELLAEIESELIRRALERAKGNKSKAAELLGVTRARLHRRLAQGEPAAAETVREQHAEEPPLEEEIDWQPEEDLE